MWFTSCRSTARLVKPRVDNTILLLLLLLLLMLLLLMLLLQHSRVWGVKEGSAQAKTPTF